MTSPNDLAYDGSNEPQKRDLTARERDILCRVINDIIRVARKYDGEVVPIADFNCVPIRIGEPEFLLVLNEIRNVINPRND